MIFCRFPAIRALAKHRVAAANWMGWTIADQRKQWNPMPVIKWIFIAD
jgi:hypothetical protein